MYCIYTSTIYIYSMNIVVYVLIYKSMTFYRFPRRGELHTCGETISGQFLRAFRDDLHRRKGRRSVPHRYSSDQFWL